MAGTKKHKAEPTLQAIGKRLKALRLQQGHTSAERFAYENEIDRKQYGNYENGANMQMTSFLKLCKALDITPEEFFKGVK